MSQKRASTITSPSRNTRSRTTAPDDLMEEEFPLQTNITQTHHLSSGSRDTQKTTGQMSSVAEHLTDLRSIKFSDLGNCFHSLRSMYGIPHNDLLGSSDPSDYCTVDDIVRIIMLVGHKAESKARTGEIATLKSSMTSIMRTTDELRRNVADIGSSHAQIVSKMDAGPTIPSILPVTTATIPSPPVVSGIITLLRFVYITDSTKTKYGRFLGSVYDKIKANPTEFSQWLARLSDNVDEVGFRKSVALIKNKYEVNK